MSPVRPTNPGNEALHLAKAEEYLGAAALLLDGRHFDAAASSASHRRDQSIGRHLCGHAFPALDR